jgi:hypothetical protein
VDAAGDIFAPDGIELSPAGQPFATATAATIVATSGGNAGIVDPNTAVQGQAILPNAQVVTGLGLSFGRGIVGVQAELDNDDNSTVTGFFNPTFQFSGATVSKPGSIPAAVAVQANGQIVIAGTNSAGGFGGTSTFGLARLTATGSLDTAFGSNGVLTTSFQGNDHVVAVLIRPGNGDPFPFPPTARPSRPPRQTGRPPVWRGSLPASAGRRARAITVTAARTTPITTTIACVRQTSPQPMASRPAAKPNAVTAGQPVTFFAAPRARPHFLTSRPRPGHRRRPGRGLTRSRWRPGPGKGQRPRRTVIRPARRQGRLRPQDANQHGWKMPG